MSPRNINNSAGTESMANSLGRLGSAYITNNPLAREYILILTCSGQLKITHWLKDDLVGAGYESMVVRFELGL